MPEKGYPIFSIGHSHHSRERFIELLRQYAIDIVLDVRSSPYSRHAPQFNRADMKGWLENAGMKYSFAGAALGGRPTDASMYVAGRVSYELMARTDSFLRGLRRLAKAARSVRVAIMCAEADPLECHRFLLIGRVISPALQVQHILSSGRAESHLETERRLLAVVGLAQSALFDETSNALARAYAIQASRVAYLRSSSGPSSTING